MRMSRRWNTLVIGMSLLLGACGSSESHAPPPVNRDLLLGKWEAEEPEQLFQTFEFKADKSFIVTFWHKPETVAGNYSWSSDGTISVEFLLSEEAKKACKQTLASFREDIQERGKNLKGQYGQQVSDSAKRFPDELLEKRDYRVGISEGKIVVLVLILDKDLNFRFQKPK
jgi:hypothetical protein